MAKAPFVLGIIPARGGSKGIPGKNLLPIGGKPLIVHTLEDAFAAKKLDLIVVSTDDAKIADAARTRRVRVIDRPAELAGDHAPIEGALRHAVGEVERTGSRVDVAVWLSANNPLRAEGVIDQAVAKLLETRADSVQTVARYRKPIEWALRIEGDRLLPRTGEYHFVVRRQDCPPAYHLDGAVVAMWRDALMAEDDGSLGYPRFYGRDRRAIVHPPELAVDLDDAFDLEWIRFMLEHRTPAP